ncbi:MAG: PKD domain-containing protein, partial [Bacteroidota bacterium]
SVTLTSPNSVNFFNDGRSWKMVTHGQDGFYILDFEDGISEEPTVYPQTALVNDDPANLLLGSVVDDQHLIVINVASQTLQALEYPFGAEFFTSLENVFSPEYSFDTSGTFPAYLYVTDSLNRNQFYQQQIMVRDDAGPDVDLFLGDSRCTDAPLELAYSAHGDFSISAQLWVVNGDSISTDSTLSYSVADAGETNIRVLVTDTQACTNLAQATLHVFSPPQASITTSADSACAFTDLHLLNSSTGAPLDSTQWAWYLAGDLFSESVDATLPLEVSGANPISLVGTIPGCQDSTSITFEVLTAPEEGFAATTSCENEPTQFTPTEANTSFTYLWDFGDGSTSHLNQPTYLFATPDTYEVTLTVTGDNGCERATHNEFTLHALPTASFTNEPICQGDSVQFFDNSTVLNSNLASWEWQLLAHAEDPALISEEQNPRLLFEENGSFDIQLVTTSTFGCADSLTLTVESQIVPIPEALVEVGCLYDTTLLLENTNLNGLSIRQFQWDVNGNSSAEDSVLFLTDTAGTFDYSLTLDYSNGCRATNSGEFTISDLPSGTLVHSNLCDNQINQLEIQGAPAGTQFTWLLPNAGNPTGRLITTELSEAGANELQIILEDAQGCADTLVETVMVNPAPVASLMAANSFGGAPLEVSLWSTSSTANSLLWFSGNEAGDTDTQDSVQFIYPNEGVFFAQHIVFSEAGCTDTVQQRIEVVQPVFDLSIISLQLISEESGYRPIINLSNDGTLNAEEVTVTFQVGNQPPLTLSLEGDLGVGQTQSYTLPITFDSTRTGPSTFCIEVSATNSLSFPDQTPNNNQTCQVLNSSLQTFAPYPNPTTESVTLKLVSPTASVLQCIVADALGNVLINSTNQDINPGNNLYQVDLSSLPAGAYMVWLVTPERSYSYWIIKN